MAVPARHADSTPMGTANSTDSRMVHTASTSVGSTRWAISHDTGRLDAMEWPRSSRSRFCAYSPNCWYSGRSRFRLLRMVSICSWLALSPAISAAGSPEPMCSSMKITISTVSMTGMTASSRLVIRRSMG